MSLPPNRGHVPTEQRHEASGDLDALGTPDAIALMVEDHRRVADALDEARGVLARFIDDLVDRMRAGGRLVYVGAGTSGRLGVLDAAECPPTFRSEPGRVVGIIAGGDRSLRVSSEGREDERDGAAAALAELELTNRDTVLGIAAGGTTPYVLGALPIARGAGAMTGLLTCATPDPAPEACDHLILLDTGPELLTGSTRLKGGSVTKLALNVITTVAFTRLGKVYGNLMVDVRATNDKLRDRAIRILGELCPGTGRAEAAACIERAGGDLKTAVVMRTLDLDCPGAKALLQRHDGRLRDALER
ncbi:MAG: N-acetylmuramic acid 6-phosphate etherase [Planctomycetes bacterium]|nr:N-acetylmuramic acid 6-phosphate etherase [Planctomycetota bacterium]